MRTGVFEWMGVQACKMAKGDKTQVRTKVQILTALLAQKYNYLQRCGSLLLLHLCGLTALLSPLLDTDTTLLLSLLALLVQEYTRCELLLLLLLCGLAALLSPYSIYLLYWYNSTNTDAEGAAAAPAALRFDCATVGIHGQC
jgi:Na+/H+ antiporter NhaD/arsenite permease-like protein